MDINSQKTDLNLEKKKIFKFMVFKNTSKMLPNKKYKMQLCLLKENYKLNV